MNNQNSLRYIMLDDKWCVPEEFFNRIKNQVTEIIPAVTPDTDYTLQDLCGNEFWLPLPFGDRKLAGRCMVYLVQHDVLPFKFSGRLCQSPKKYCLK